MNFFVRLTTPLLAMLASGGLQAVPLPTMLDPDGIGTQFGAIEVDAWDWTFGNVLAVGGNTALAAWQANEASGSAHGGADEKFTTLGQSKLGALRRNGADVTTSNLKGGPGGGDAEFTLVFRFPEVVTGFDGTNATFLFDLAADPTTDTFFEIYYQDSANYGGARDANNLAGTGFNNGTLVLEGTVRTDAGIGPFASSFNRTGGGGSTPLDGFIFDDWGGTGTITGSGGRDDVDILVDILTVNTDFIKNSVNTMILQNVAQTLNFTSVDPSRRFTDTAGGVAPTVAPNVGTINGEAIGAGGGPDILFQVNPVSTTASVAEPASILLLCIGGLGLFGSRYQRHKAHRLH